MGIPVTVEVRSAEGFFHPTPCESQACVDAIGEGVAYGLAGTKILYRVQIELTFVGGNIGDVANPYLIWL